MKKAVIIGSGIAGISAAVRLRNKGYAVQVLEKNEYPGGKLTQITENGFRFDAGPSLFTMPDLVTAFFINLLFLLAYFKILKMFIMIIY